MGKVILYILFLQIKEKTGASFVHLQFTLESAGFSDITPDIQALCISWGVVWGSSEFVVHSKLCYFLFLDFLVKTMK